MWYSLKQTSRQQQYRASEPCTNALALRVFACVGACCIVHCLVYRASSSCTSSACTPVFWTTPCLSHPTMPAFLISLFMCICFIQAIVFAIRYLHVVTCFMGPRARDFVGVVVLDLVDLLHELAANCSARCVLIFFSFLLLLIISRANVMFAYLTDEIRVGFHNAEFACLKTMIM